MTSAADVRTVAPPDPDEVVPTPIRDWLRAKPGRPIVAAAAAILLFQLVLRGWLGVRGYFFLDDFAFEGRAADSSVLNPHYLLLAYNSHLMPGSFVWVWVLAKLAPYNFTVVVLVDLVLQAVLGLVFFRLLRALFGMRPAILVPFAVGTLSAITLPAFLWWAAALNQLPEQIAMVTALLYLVRYLRSGRWQTGVLSAGAVAGGLLFSEKSLFIVPLVVGFVLLFATSGSPWNRVVHLVCDHIRVWCAYLIIVVPYTLYYLLAVPSPTHPVPSGGALGQLVTQSLGHALIPGLVGGPWTWVKVGDAGGLAAPTPFARMLALVVVVLVVAGTIALRARAWRGWAWALAYATMNITILAVSRATFIGPVIGDEYRYITDVAIVAAIGATLSVLPINGSWSRGGPERVAIRPGLRNVLHSNGIRDLRAAVPRPREDVVAAVLVVAFAASATASSLAYDKYWRTNPARAYMDRVKAAIATMPPGTVVADERVPNDVAWALLGDYSFESRLLAPLPSVPQFLRTGQAVENLQVIDATGRIQRAVIQGTVAAPGPDRTCGWRLGNRQVHIRMQNDSYPGQWTLRIGYLSSADTSATVSAGQTTLTVPFRRGLGAVSFLVTGPVGRVDVSPLSNDATVCTNDVGVGIPVPAVAP